MRYEKGRKDASRRRIMAAATERFHKDGSPRRGEGLISVYRRYFSARGHG